MAKKPTIDFIRTEIEKEDYRLITKIYKNNKQRLELLCPREHTYFVSWSSWNLLNSRCVHCYNEDIKPSIDFIRAEVEKEGYKLVTNVYSGNKQKLELICPRGHTYFVSWNHWSGHNSNSRCMHCYIEDTKPSIEFIKAAFEKEGYTLLTTEYKNNSTKLKYICPNGYRHQITWGHWNTSKARCPCHACNTIGNNIKYTLEQAVQEYKKIGYTLLATEYSNSNTKMKCICDENHTVYMSLYSIMHGHKCQICVRNGKLSIEEVRESFKKEGYTLLSTIYEGNKQKLKYRCDQEHIHWMRFDGWAKGQRCPTCYRIRMSIERSGSGHWNWKGGISGDSYCPIWKDKEYAESIKQRDGYKCMNPCCNSKNPNNLVRHHINYDKQDCRLKNIITTCTSCNPAANTDRAWHEAWYKAIMYRRYGYTYE